jgi:hypothetical protein
VQQSGLEAAKVAARCRPATAMHALFQCWEEEGGQLARWAKRSRLAAGPIGLEAKNPFRIKVDFLN